jgi:transposase
MSAKHTGISKDDIAQAINKAFALFGKCKKKPPKIVDTRKKLPTFFRKIKLQKNPEKAKYINNEPHTGKKRVISHPQEQKNETGDRQRQNRDRNPDLRGWTDLWPKEISWTPGQNCHPGKNPEQIKLDQWGALNTPEVGRSINMVSTPHDIQKEIDNKFFQKISLKNKQKVLRAQEILQHPKTVKRTGPKTFMVRSQTGRGWYTIELINRQWQCNCPDFETHGKYEPCKHILALKLMYLQIHNPGYIKKVQSPRKTYKRNWAAYNRAKAQEFELFDKFLYHLLVPIKEPETPRTAGRPSIPVRDQLFCCMIKAYSNRPLREIKWLINAAYERNQIKRKYHENIVSMALNREDLTPLLRELVQLSAAPFSGIETHFSLDSSGFRCSTFGHYNEEKHGCKQERNWIKAHICTGVKTNVITSAVILEEHSPDCPQLAQLLADTAKYFEIKEVSADAAYSSRYNITTIVKHDAIPYIPFKKNATANAKGSMLWTRAYHYFQLHPEEFMKHYHKRSNVEATLAALKKKLKETITSRNRTAQINEMYCKIIAYNITVLIREWVRVGGLPDIMPLIGDDDMTPPDQPVETIGKFDPGYYGSEINGP